MKQWFTAQEIAEAQGVNPSTVARQAKREGWEAQQRIGRGGGYEYHLHNLPEAAQAKLLLQQVNTSLELQQQVRKDVPYDRDALWANYARKTEKQKTRAQEKLNILLQMMALVDKGMPLMKALSYVSHETGRSAATIKNWYFGVGKKEGVRNYERGDWLAVLVPGNTGSKEFAECSPEAWQVFKADFLRLEAPSWQACYHRLQRTAAEKGWTVPSIDSFKRRMNAEVSKPVQVMMREGEHALMRLYPSQQRDVSTMHALEHINGDGYQHNVWVAIPGQEKPVRMKTWFWQDVYSRKILAWRTDFSENTDQIRLSFGELVEDYGIPHHVTIDNTRAAANKIMTGGVANRYRFKVKPDDPMGIFPMLGVQVHWTSVLNGHGHGQAKPIERAFGVGGLGEYVDKHPAFAGAWTGDSPMNKPENYGSRAVPLDEFERVLNQEILAWNALQKRSTQMAAGHKSFDEVFAESYATAAIRKATAEQRRLWLLAAESIRVAKDASITLEAGAAKGFGKNRYHCAELFDRVGDKLVVRFDPMDLHDHVYVYDLEGRFIAEATCIQAAGFRDTVAAREHKRARTAMMKGVKAQAELQNTMDALEVAQQIPLMEEPDKPENNVSQVAFRQTFTQGNTLRVVDAVAEQATDAEQQAEAEPQSEVEHDRYQAGFSKMVRMAAAAKKAQQLP